ncbi:hypothetical protein ACFQ9X_18875 [Catenulispora yoronensis]
MAAGSAPRSVAAVAHAGWVSVRTLLRFLCGVSACAGVAEADAATSAMATGIAPAITACARRGWAAFGMGGSFPLEWHAVRLRETEQQASRSSLRDGDLVYRFKTLASKLPIEVVTGSCRPGAAGGLRHDLRVTRRRNSGEFVSPSCSSTHIP